MVLSPEEQAELDRLTAKASEPAPVVRQASITLPADFLKVIQDLVHAHWSQLPADAYEAFTGATSAALAEPEPEPPAEPEPAPEPAEDATAEPAAFGTESESGSEPDSHEV